MPLLRFLLTSNYRIAALIIFVGLLSGALSAALIAVINTALHTAGRPSLFLIAGVAALVLGKAASGVLSTWLLIGYAQQTVLDLSISLCRKILSARYRLLEETGGDRLLTTLTSDVPTLSAALICTRKGVSHALLPQPASAAHAVSSRVLRSRPSRWKTSP